MSRWIVRRVAVVRQPRRNSPRSPYRDGPRTIEGVDPTTGRWTWRLSKPEPRSVRSSSTFRKRHWKTCAAASRRRACPPKSSSPIGRRACSWRRCRQLASYWATEYDWRKAEARLNALPQFTTEIDGVDIHFIHVQVGARERAAADHDARLAGLGHRAARDRRPADRPDRARRQRRGRVPPRAAVRPRLRLLRRADRGRLGPGPDRTGVGRADAPPRLHPLRRPGRRRRRRRHGRDGPPGTRGADRHPHEPARAGAGRRRCRRTTDEERAAAAQIATFQQSGNGYFVEMATRPQTIGYALLDSPVALAAWMLDHDTDAYYKIAGAFVDGQPVGQPHPRPHPRQHHAVLADRHRRLRGPVVLGGLRAGRAGRGPPAAAAAGRSRSASRRSPARSGGLRAAGSRRATRTSSTSTRSTRAATSPPGRSRSSSPRNCAQRSRRFAEENTVPTVRAQKLTSRRSS